jgi:hypothetical protein
MTTSLPIPVVPPFDYSTIDPSTAAHLQAQANRIRSRVRKTTAEILDIGRDLHAAKQHLDHGQFLNWVLSEVGIKPRTAQRYMSVAQLCDKNDSLTHLPASIVYLLAPRSVPSDIISQVAAKAAGCEIVSEAVVADMISDANVQRREQRRKQQRARRLSNKARAKQERAHLEYERRRAQQREAAARAVAGWIDQVGIPAATALLKLRQQHDLFFDQELQRQTTVAGEQEHL